MSAMLNRLLASPNLAQIVPENKGALNPAIDNTSQTSSNIAIFTGLIVFVIILAFIVFALVRRHKRHHYHS